MSYSHSDYWREAIDAALEEVGGEALFTDEQKNLMAGVIQGANENINQAFGYDCIPHPLSTELAETKKKLSAEIERQEARADLYKKEACKLAKVDPKNVWDREGEIWYLPR